MIQIQPQPDFDRFRDTLLLQAAHRRPPLFDFHVDAAHKAQVLGQPVSTPGADAEFWRRAGYDYVQCTIHAVVEEVVAAADKGRDGAASIGEQHSVVHSLDQFRSRRWSWQAAAEGDLACVRDRLEWLQELVRVLPDGMRILLHNGDVFTNAWMLMGFDAFCFASVQDPELVRTLMNSLAAAQLNVTRAALAQAGPAVGALFYSDDIAYTEGLMLSPTFYGEYLFPHIAAFAELGAAQDLPLIYHTDGRLYDAFDQLAAIGVNGIQPLEPKSMDPLEIRRRWPGRFCLMGNVDLDLMSRGTPAQVEAHVRERIERLNTDGGFMPGVSNTVPDYVQFENYQRMIETVYSYGE